MNTDKLAINWQNFSTSAQVCFYNTALSVAAAKFGSYTMGFKG